MFKYKTRSRPPATVHSAAATDKQQKCLYRSVRTSVSSFPASGCARTQRAHAFTLSLACLFVSLVVVVVVVVVMHIDTVARGETAWNSIQTNRVGVPPTLPSSPRSSNKNNDNNNKGSTFTKKGQEIRERTVQQSKYSPTTNKSPVSSSILLFDGLPIIRAAKALLASELRLTIHNLFPFFL